MNNKNIFEFLCKLIDIQIKKYVKLATIGVGPDARLNANLVLKEVDELINFGQTLIELMNKVEHEPNQQEMVISIFNQIRFYVEQEHLRSYAGWLLDENNIHSGVKARVEEQLTELSKLAQEANINIASPADPVTPTQTQCKHDSSEIAYYILSIAKNLNENPDYELNGDIPSHARLILKKNTQTRYQDPKFVEPIKKLYAECKTYIDTSTLQKTTTSLTKDDAIRYQEVHKGKIDNLISDFKKIHPNSSLFAPNSRWYSVAEKKEAPTAETASSSSLSFNKVAFWGARIAFGGLGVYMLLSYFSNAQEINNLGTDFSNLS